MVMELSKVYKSFRTLRQRVAAVQNVSFAVGQSEIVGFVGPNGAGKSTTIKMLMGFLRADAGSIKLFGMPAGHPDALRRLGFMPERPAFPDTLTGREWLRYAYRLYCGHEPTRSRVDEVLAETGLAQAGKRLIRGYSKGMLQRLGLAQALIADPDLLILDEPLSGLDPLGRTLFKDILRTRAEQGKTLFFSSHILDDVEHLCSRVLLLDRGSILVDKPITELLYRHNPAYSVRFGGTREIPGFASQEEGGGQVIHNLDQEQLQHLLAQAAQAGAIIIEVKAERPTLESLFVEIVKKDGA